MRDPQPSDLKPAATTRIGSSALLACPFCGGPAEVLEENKFVQLVKIGCSNEKCAAQPEVSGVGGEMAIARWNRRAG